MHARILSRDTTLNMRVEKSCTASLTVGNTFYNLLAEVPVLRTDYVRAILQQTSVRLGTLFGIECVLHHLLRMCGMSQFLPSRRKSISFLRCETPNLAPIKIAMKFSQPSDSRRSTHSSRAGSPEGDQKVTKYFNGVNWVMENSVCNYFFKSAIHFGVLW